MPKQRQKFVDRPMTEILEIFCNELSISNRSPITVRNYLQIGRPFLRDSGIKLLSDFTAENIRAWYSDLMNPDDDEEAVSPTTLRTYDTHIRGWANWLHRRGYLAKNPMSEIAKPKRVRTVVEIFSQAELVEIFAAAAKGRHPLRRTAMCKLLLDTGIRRGELLSLTLDRIHWRQRTLLVDGKTGPRQVAFTNSAGEALKRYIDHERTAGSPYANSVFLASGGKPLQSSSLTHDFIHLAREAGIERDHVGPHTMRHTYAVEYLRAGGDIVSLKTILGHSDVQTTMIYLRFLEGEAGERSRTFSPLARIRL